MGVAWRGLGSPSQQDCIEGAAHLDGRPVVMTWSGPGQLSGQGCSKSPADGEGDSCTLIRGAEVAFCGVRLS